MIDVGAHLCPDFFSCSALRAVHFLARTQGLNILSAEPSRLATIWAIRSRASAKW